MIKIIRNDGTSTRILEVPNGAFESIYRQQGYVPFESVDGGEQTAADESGVSDKSNDDLFLDAVEMKPISQWTKKELQRYAQIAGIDQTADDKPLSVADLRESVKQRIEDGRH